MIVFLYMRQFQMVRADRLPGLGLAEPVQGIRE